MTKLSCGRESADPVRRHPNVICCHELLNVLMTLHRRMPRILLFGGSGI